MALTTCKECGSQISGKAEKCPQCGAPQKRRTSFFTWLVTIILAVWAVSAILVTPGHESPKRDTSAKQIAMENVDLDFAWSRAGFGSVMSADFTITNNSQYWIKDIVITCLHSGKSGTIIDKNERTVYDMVPANGKKTFLDFNMGFIHSQTATSNCRITDLRANSDHKELPLPVTTPTATPSFEQMQPTAENQQKPAKLPAKYIVKPSAPDFLKSGQTVTVFEVTPKWARLTSSEPHQWVELTHIKPAK